MPEIGPPGLRWRGLETGRKVPRQSSTLLQNLSSLAMHLSKSENAASVSEPWRSN